MSSIQVNICDRCGTEARSDKNNFVFNGFSFVHFGMDAEPKITRHFCAGCVIQVGAEFKKEPRDFPTQVRKQ